MKIVYISTAFPRDKEDRVNPWLFETVKKLKEKNLEIIVFTSSYRALKQKEIEGIKVYRFRYLPKNYEILTHDVAVPERWKMGMKYRLMTVPYMIAGIFNSILFAFKENFDIIHVHWPFPHIFFGALMKLIKRKPMICSFHGGEIIFLEKLPLFLKKIFVLFLKFSDCFTVNSTFTKNKLLKIYASFKNNKIYVVPFGITLKSAFKNNLERKENRVIRILFAGRLIERKGVHILIRAFKKISETLPDSILIIAGDGPWREKLEDLTQKLGLGERVKFKGHLSAEKLEEEYKKADVFVLPSIHDVKGDTETLGVVLIEAMEFGIPVVATSVGGIPDIVKDGYNGLLVPEKDPDALADAIIKLIKNKDLREKFVKNAKKYIREKFSWDVIIEKLTQIYADLTKKVVKR